MWNQRDCRFGSTRARCRAAGGADARRHRASRPGRCRDCSSTAQAALGHRRLSIVDLAAGHQPLANEDGTIWIVFNGEIYNHADVRPELEAAGHRYRTRSDTETIVHAYEQWGDACVERLRGMFAFAIWDAPKRPAAARARSPRRQAALLGAGRQPAAVRLRDQVDPRERPDSRRGRRVAAPRAAQHPLPLGRRDAVQGHPPAAARPHARLRERHGHDPRSTGTCRPGRGDESLAQLSEQDAVQQFRARSRRRCASG